jgi:hypothetical protein
VYEELPCIDKEEIDSMSASLLQQAFIDVYYNKIQVGQGITYTSDF